MRQLALPSAILLSFLNLFVQLPLTPLVARELSPSLGLVGLAVAAYSVANLAGNVFSGLLVDRWPRGPLIAAGLLAGGLALLGAGWGPPGIGWLIGCLALNGLALSVVTPAAFALLLQRQGDGARVAALSRSGAAIGLGALFGPPLGGLLGDALGGRGAYAAAGGALVLAALALGALLGRDAPEGGGEGPDLAALGRVAAEPRLRLAYAGAFVLMAANGALVFLLPPVVRALGAPKVAVGALFGTFALTALALFLTPAARWSARLGAPGALALGGAVVAAACLALGRAGALPAMLGCMAVYGLGFGLVYLGASERLAQAAPPGRRGTATGLFYAVFSLGAAASPLVLGQLGLGGAQGFAWAAALPALLSAGLLLRLGAGRLRRARPPHAAA